MKRIVISDIIEKCEAWYALKGMEMLDAQYSCIDTIIPLIEQQGYSTDDPDKA